MATFNEIEQAAFNSDLARENRRREADDRYLDSLDEEDMNAQVGPILRNILTQPERLANILKNNRGEINE